MESFIHAVFDPHTYRTRAQTLGPSFTLSSHIDDITALQNLAEPLLSAQEISARLLQTGPNESRVPCGDVFSLLSDTSCCPKVFTRPYDEPILAKRDVDIPWPSRMDSGSLFASSFTNNATFPRNKQKQKCNSPLSHCASPSVPWEIGRTSYEQLTPYPSAENLLKRPSSAPERDEGAPHAGPSRLSWREIHFMAEKENKESMEEHGNSLGDHEDTTSSGDGWISDLLKQLQEEEEITASLGYQVSCEDAWLVALQKRVLGLELDWQLAAQLQEAETHILFRSPRKMATSLVQEVVNSGSRNMSDFTFDCGICGDSYDNNVKISLVVCGHTYCRDCVTALVKAKIDDNRYPIVCPDCLVDRSRTDKCRMSFVV